MRALRLALLALAALVFGPLSASAQIDRLPKVHARLVGEGSEIAPGGKLAVAFEQKIRPGWHTYWQNPGEAGAPTALAWQLPPGWSADAIAWPYPKHLPVGPLMDYGYEGQVWLLTAVHAPADAAPGTRVTLRATGSWLVCKEVCVPEDGAVELPLTVAANPAPPSSAIKAAFAAARAKLPQASPWPMVYAATPDRLDLYLRAPALAAARPAKADFFPLTEGQIRGAEPQTLGLAKDGIVLRLAPVAKFAANAAHPPLSGVLVLTSKDGSVQALEVKASPGAVPPARFDGTTTRAGFGLLLALLFAFAGGLILNLMPCVLPILAMKAVALSSAAGAHPRQTAREGFAYSAGAILSMMALGGLLVALRAGGEAIGWGFQLQQPVVVAGFALLMFAVGLNLSGVFEIAGLAAGEGLTRKGGTAGAFFTGVLAVAVAAPCTAPFMAAALGFALTQPAAIALAVFLALGLGFAAPFALIGISPRLLRVLPRPGAWMLRLRQLLAFPMYGAAVWLVWVLAQQAGANAVLAVLAAMVALALAAWLWNAGRNASSRWRLATTVLALAAFVLTLLGLGAVQKLGTVTQTAQAATQTAHLPSQPYTAARLAGLREQNRAVFVNATAAWCITCLVNEQVAFSDSAVEAAFAQHKVAYLVADWTNRNPEITRLLETYQRSGVPLYLYFAPGAATAKILPQILTPGELTAAITSAH